MTVFEDGDLRERLEAYQIGLGRYSDALTGAGFVGDRLADVSPRVLVALSIPSTDWQPLLAALSSIAAEFIAAAAPSELSSITGSFEAFIDHPIGSAPFAPPALGWVREVAELWPSPIAYEYHELWKTMDANQIVAAVWQLKDLGEVLVKFPALIVASDVLSNGSAESREIVRQGLFGGPLSFGRWIAFLRSLVPVLRTEREHLAFPEVMRLFYSFAPGSSSSEETSLCRAMATIVNFRNDLFAHALYRENPKEFNNAVGAVLEPLNKALSETATNDPWSGISLRLGDANGATLAGWEELKQHRDTPLTSHQHHNLGAPLFLTKTNRALLLWPLMGVRVCKECGKRDIFLYDSRSSVSEAADFILLDYFAGHRMAKKPSEEPELAQTAANVKFELVENADLIAEDYGQAGFEELLLRKASGSAYLAPTYLHAVLTAFIKDNTKGVFWLSTPGHTGKSVFVRGLTDPDYRTKVEKSAPWLNGAVTCRFAIKREIQYSPRELVTTIRQEVLEKGFGLREKQKRFPEPDLSERDRAKAFTAYLHEIAALRPSTVQRVVLFIDGLDELRPPVRQPSMTPSAMASLDEFLPLPNQLPEHFYFIITSRPTTDCPEFVAKTLKQSGYGTIANSRHAELQFEGSDELASGYRALLHEYYDREVADRRKQTVYDTLEKLRAAGEDVQPDFRQITNSWLRQITENAWKKAAHHPGPQAKGAPVSLAESIEASSAWFDHAFEAIYAKARGRFAFVAFLTDLIANGEVGLKEISTLPSETPESADLNRPAAPSRLYTRYLENLAAALSGGPDSAKHWNYVRRILVILAADEEAHAIEAAAVKEIYPDVPYQGMSLERLAQRLEEPGVTYRLVSAIYCFQPLLVSWRGNSEATTHFGLGLKDLMPTLRELYGSEIEKEHRDAAGEPRGLTLGDLMENIQVAAKRSAPALIQYLCHMCATEQGNSDVAWLKVRGEIEVVGRLLSARHLERLAVTLESVSIFSGEDAKARLGSAWSHQQDNYLAEELLRRAGTRSFLADNSGAIADCGRAMSLWEAMDQSSGETSYDEQLFGAYQFRAVLRARLSNENLLEDLDRAVELGEKSVARASEDRRVHCETLLADAYLKRAGNRENFHNHQGAMADSQKACEILRGIWIALGRLVPVNVQSAKEVGPVFATAVLQRSELWKAESKPQAAARDEEEAISVFQTLKRLCGDSWDAACRQKRAEVLLHRARSRSESGDGRGSVQDCDEAISELEEALKNPPDVSINLLEDLAFAHYWRGRAHFKSGDVRSALADYDHIIKTQVVVGSETSIMPVNFQIVAYDERAQVRLAYGDAMGAIQDAERAVSMSQAFANSDRLGGVYLVARCRATQALAWLKLGEAARAAKVYDTTIAEMEKHLDRMGPQGEISTLLSQLRDARSKLHV